MFLKKFVKKDIQKQGIFFLMVSGCGWLMDFCIYTVFTYCFDIPVFWANLCGSVPAVTFVFCFSTRRIFATQQCNLSIKQKYVVYMIYQVVLLLSLSFLADYLYDIIQQISWWGMLEQSKLLVKCLITPISMVSNFIFMKVLSEKI